MVEKGIRKIESNNSLPNAAKKMNDSKPEGSTPSSRHMSPSVQSTPASLIHSQILSGTSLDRGDTIPSHHNVLSSTPPVGSFAARQHFLSGVPALGPDSPGEIKIEGSRKDRIERNRLENQREVTCLVSKMDRTHLVDPTEVVSVRSSLHNFLNANFE